MRLIKFILIALTINIYGCASVPDRITDSSLVKTNFESVAYKDNYWGVGFEHIANLKITDSNLNLYDEEVDITILYKDISSIKYEKPFFTDPNNYIIVTYTKTNVEKMAYFTSFSNLGWTPGSAEIYQNILFKYENR